MLLITTENSVLQGIKHCKFSKLVQLPLLTQSSISIKILLESFYQQNVNFLLFTTRLKIFLPNLTLLRSVIAAAQRHIAGSSATKSNGCWTTSAVVMRSSCSSSSSMNQSRRSLSSGSSSSIRCSYVHLCSRIRCWSRRYYFILRDARS